jgi:hypothetical protein
MDLLQCVAEEEWDSEVVQALDYVPDQSARKWLLLQYCDNLHPFKV